MTLRPLTDGEAPEAAARAAVAMGASHDEEAVESWRSRVRMGAAWGLERDGRIVGHCVLTPTDHWLGGRPVPSLDIASVAVAPEHRAQGVAREMMVEAAARGAADGLGMSLLFPATTAMYRKLGWELAGAYQRYRVPTRAVPADGPLMRAADRDGDWRAIRDCQQRAVRCLQGPAVRSDQRWAHLAEAPHRYALDDERGDGIEAFALVRQRHVEGDWQHVVVLADWAATTERGLRAVVSLVGRWSTFGSAAEFIDTVPSQWSGVVPEQDIEHAGGMQWMARALDLPAAIAARGFPRGVSVALTLRVEGEPDPGPGTRGPWRLEVADGRARLEPAESAEVVLRPRATGPLLTGFRTARELRLLGLLDGPDEALESLDAAFVGPPPVVVDFF